MIDHDAPQAATSRHRIESFVGRVLLVLLLVTLFAGGAALVVVAADVLLMAFAGILLAIGLRGAARGLSRRTGLGEGWSLGVVLLVLTLLIGLGGWLVAATFAAQMNELWESITAATQEGQAWLRQWPWGARLLGQGAGGGGGGVQGGVGEISQVDMVGRAARFFSATLGAFGMLVVIGFVGLYLAVEPGLYRRGLVRLFPKRQRPRAEETLDELNDVLYSWLIGRLINMSIIGVATAIGLWALGVPLVLALSLIAFVLDFIPYVGPILSTIPAVIVAFSVGPQVALYVVILYLGVQTVESYLLTPLIQKKAVELPPALTIVSQVLLGGLVGVLGLAMAPPLTAAIMTLVERLYIEDVLDDHATPPGTDGQAEA